MIALIIFGTKAVTGHVDNGQFTCPSCNQPRDYQHMRVRRFFTLYFIPLIPLGTIAEYIECLLCRSKFKMELLTTGRPPGGA